MRLPFMAIAGLCADWFAPYSPTANDFAAMTEPPSWAHWLGTDQFGRDLLSRIIYGARTALIVGFSCAIIASVVGLVLGPRVKEWRGALPFLGVGVLFGLSYVSLFEAYYRGRVTVVSPLVATESLWGVMLALLLIRHTELVGRRVLIGAALTVAGGALIGVAR